MFEVPGRPRTGAAEKVALALWVAAALAVAVRLVAAADPRRNNVYLKVLAPAAEAFWRRDDLYGGAEIFRYPPLCAAMLWPFTALGEVAGSVLWRLLNFAVLFAGLRATFVHALPAALSSRERALALVLALALGVGGLNNGQANALVLGCLLLAAATARRGHAVGPGALVGAATCVKVYPFAFGLVLATLRPRLWWTLLLGLLLVLALPYGLAPAAYVTHQYEALAQGLAAEDRTQDAANAYRDLRLLAAALGLPLPPLVFLGLQGLGGLAIVLGARRLRRGGDSRAFAFATAATLCWMLLLGPSTEKVTYQFLALPLAWQLALAWREGARGRRMLLGAAAVLALVDVAPWTPSRELQAAWPLLRCLSPLATVLVAIDLTREALAAGRENAGDGRDTGAALP